MTADADQLPLRFTGWGLRRALCRALPFRDFLVIFLLHSNDLPPLLFHISGIEGLAAYYVG